MNCSGASARGCGYHQGDAYAFSNQNLSCDLENSLTAAADHAWHLCRMAGRQTDLGPKAWSESKRMATAYLVKYHLMHLNKFSILHVHLLTHSHWKSCRISLFPYRDVCVDFGEHAIFKKSAFPFKYLMPNGPKLLLNHKRGLDLIWISSECKHAKGSQGNLLYLGFTGEELLMLRNSHMYWPVGNR